MSAAPACVLEAVYLEVVARGVAVAPRDYRDALVALQRGFGLRTRERLLRLCTALWARTEEEIAIVCAVFHSIAPPSAAEVAAFEDTHAARRSPPATSERAADAPAPREARPPSPEVRDADKTRLQFVLPEEAEQGLALPGAALGALGVPPFIQSTIPLLSRRQMTVCWRRFRSLSREGPRTTLDVRATIDRECRTGRLDSPVFASERRNRARLVLAIDVSPSMIAWRELCEDLVLSLEDSRLGRHRVYYFENVPGEAGLYGTPDGGDVVPLSQVWDETGGSAAIIVSDAGAARGRRRPERRSKTTQFLRLARRYWNPVSWLNPMPRARWRGTTAQLIAAEPGQLSFPLGAEGLLRAIDVLRGQRTS